jgi:catechol 2,3-dioxygenase-like lactoylglutathione lyase family enzyme
MSVLPGPIRQIGYVVTDLDRALASWVELGVGPWLVMRGLQIHALYRGKPCETTLSLALSNSGELQVELIQQEDGTPSIFTEFLASNGPGYHQLAYWAEDFDATMKAVEEAGWPVVWSGGEGLGVRFAYVEPPNSPAHISQIIEISQLTDAQAGVAKFIRDAATNWDGSNPIREMNG